MPRALLLLFAVLLLTFHAVAQAPSEPSCRTFLECQARVHSWEQWSNENVPKCKQAMADTTKFEAENKQLRADNQELRSLGNTRIDVNLIITAVGIGVGVFGAFWLLRGLKRAWSVSNKGKQLMFMVCGAVWITGAAVIAVNDSDLTKHPVNMLFTVLVYSLPGLLFSGIGFWWFGKPKQQEPTP